MTLSTTQSCARIIATANLRGQRTELFLYPWSAYIECRVLPIIHRLPCTCCTFLQCFSSRHHQLPRRPAAKWLVARSGELSPSLLAVGRWTDPGAVQRPSKWPVPKPQRESPCWAPLSRTIQKVSYLSHLFPDPCQQQHGISLSPFITFWVMLWLIL